MPVYAHYLKNLNGFINFHFLYSNDDPSSIADAIEKFISLPKDFKEELKEKALNIARNYTWEKHAEKDAFLRRLLLEFSRSHS